MIYGAGAPKVAESFTLNTGRLFTVEEAKLIRDNFKAAYPGLAWLMADCQKRARNDGYVENAWGRRLYVESERAYVATDYLVQSSGRDVLTDAILNTAEYLKPYGGRLLIPIHDELFTWVPEEPSDSFLAGLGEAMTNYKFSLPMTVTPKKGVTFAGLK
jgi:DNA polymerase-1